MATTPKGTIPKGPKGFIPSRNPILSGGFKAYWGPGHTPYDVVLKQKPTDWPDKNTPLDPPMIIWVSLFFINTGPDNQVIPERRVGGFAAYASVTNRLIDIPESRVDSFDGLSNNNITQVFPAHQEIDGSDTVVYYNDGGTSPSDQLQQPEVNNYADWVLRPQYYALRSGLQELARQLQETHSGRVWMVVTDYSNVWDGTPEDWGPGINGDFIGGDIIDGDGDVLIKMRDDVNRLGTDNFVITELPVPRDDIDLGTDFLHIYLGQPAEQTGNSSGGFDWSNANTRVEYSGIKDSYKKFLNFESYFLGYEDYPSPNGFQGKISPPIHLTTVETPTGTGTTYSHPDSEVTTVIVAGNPGHITSTRNYPTINVSPNYISFNGPTQQDLDDIYAQEMEDYETLLSAPADNTITYYADSRQLLSEIHSILLGEGINSHYQEVGQNALQVIKDIIKTWVEKRIP